LSVLAPSETDTEATGTGAGALTVTVDEAVCPSLEAVIDTFPAARAVTSPKLEAVAIPGLAEVQLITRPVRTLLLASRVTADSCTVPPTCRLAVPGETVTDATGMGAGALTAKADEAVFPSLEAAIIAVPAASAVTSPVGATVATLVLALCQVMVRPMIAVPVGPMLDLLRDQRATGPLPSDEWRRMQWRWARDLVARRLATRR
jgi:hypothetical protein